MAADPLTTNTVNELLNYDVSDDDDPFADTPITKTRDDKSTLSPRAAKRKLDDNDKENLGLGLDEEVKISKKRKPVAKLDDNRLLSQPGIPKLRTLARSGQVSRKLHFKGKGHEFQDVARLLNYYQLWLDNLYPRAKFADGLQLIENAGHSKRMNVMRKEWIDEGKPGYARDKALRKKSANGDEDQADEVQMSGAVHTDTTNPLAANEQSHRSIFGNGDSNDLFFPDTANQSNMQDDLEPDEDELDALMAEHRTPQKPTAKPSVYESEGEDDLDALLAEQEQRTNSAHPPASSTTRPIPEEENDDLDALLAEQETRNSIPAPTLTKAKPKPTIFDDDDDDDSEDEGDDLDALLAEQSTRKQPELPNWGAQLVVNSPARRQQETTLKDRNGGLPEIEQDEMNDLISSSPLLNENDVDQLMTEQEARKSDEARPVPEEIGDGDELIFSSSPVPNEESQ